MKPLVNQFSPELREIVETDYYLAHLQRSLTLKQRQVAERGLYEGAYVLGALRSRIVEVRNSYGKVMGTAGLRVPIIYSATGVRYIGVRMTLRLAIYIDIEKAGTPSKLWRYCGLGLSGGIVDTVATTRHPGVVTYSNRARRIVAELRPFLLRHDSPYRRHYNTYKEAQREKGIDIYRASRRAGRYVSKLWLKHLWLVWRRQEGLEYENQHENDETRLTAPFGWR